MNALIRVVSVIELWYQKYQTTPPIFQPVMLVACPSRDGGFKWRVARIFDKPHYTYATALLDAYMLAGDEGVPVELLIGEGDRVDSKWLDPQPEPTLPPVPDPVTVPDEEEDDESDVE